MSSIGIILFFFHIIGIKHEMKRRKVTIIPPAAIGRVKKIEKFPSDMSSDSLKEFSTRGPKTNASTRGAGS